MALNLNELQQKIDRLLFNLEQMRQKAFKMFYSGMPENIEIQQYDENGVLRTYNIPNRAKFQEWVWNNAQAAMSKTLYVDTNRGSDSTGDGSESNPFRTLKKAITSMPSGSFINIFLSGENTLTSDILVINKQVIINGGAIVTSKYNSDAEPTKTGIYCFRLLNSYIQFNDVNITIPDLQSNEKIASSAYSGFICLQRGGGVRFNYADTTPNRINISSFYLVSSAGIGFGSVDLNLANANPKLRINPNKAKVLLLTSNTVAFQCPYRQGTIKDFYGNNVDIRKLIQGIILDSKGTPINMITNLKFV
jgi:hypothetical protein